MVYGNSSDGMNLPGENPEFTNLPQIPEKAGSGNVSV
jgi:hypothetical protein